jgi:hypothetical protein
MVFSIECSNKFHKDLHVRSIFFFFFEIADIHHFHYETLNFLYHNPISWALKVQKKARMKVDSIIWYYITKQNITSVLSKFQSRAQNQDSDFFSSSNNKFRENDKRVI